MKTTKEVIRVDGKLNKVVTIKDEQGKVLHKLVSPLMVEFHPKDVLQVIVGSTLLAIPVAYTEETWRLGELLPFSHIAWIIIFSVTFMAAFVYYNYYRHKLKEHSGEFIKRVSLTYLIALIVVGAILTVINQAPWSTDWILAFKRTIIVGFPASMSAAVADMLK